MTAMHNVNSVSDLMVTPLEVHVVFSKKFPDEKG
jgi:hypothetical protein